jgi:ribonucleoside-triphosphate reductase
MTKFLDGGSALHLNLEEALNERAYLQLINIAAKTGCNYFCVNVKITICNHCDHIDKKTTHICAKCFSSDIDYGTRVIGYLKRVTSFSKSRREEHNRRYYHLTKKTSDPIALTSNENLTCETNLIKMS